MTNIIDTIIRTDADMANALAERGRECSDTYLSDKLACMATDEGRFSVVEQAMLFAAADRLGIDVFRGPRSKVRETKGEAAERLYPEGLDDVAAVDTALPQPWVDRVHDLIANNMHHEDVVRIDRQGGVAAQFVTAYNERGSMTIVPITRLGVDLLAWLVKITV